ncbi:restriction endonuclease subunit S [Trabulsiella odontotermitis]|uniref:restriction endonuclease subunit S n=1 Tax=Trabulsiella odontotermitis TaxID=379893 RepID=UPI00067666C1|nr:restriction endonuclease subunit S [Trabulsiella odontotermitis]KNC90587.1 hypothetical protein GM30_02030 [Trabulsiella odontotermitis]
MMVPKLRFKGFSKNWYSNKLENIFSFKNGLNASKEMYGNGIKFINVLDIINNDKITFDTIQESVQATDEQISSYQVKQGDILFQRSSETREEVGQANVYADTNPVLFGGFVIRGRPLVKLNSAFINYQLKTDILRKDLTQRSGGSTRYNIGQESLGKVTAFFPELEEQNKIADFLSSIDKKIALLNKQYVLLNLYKKGAMQKIFCQEIFFKDDKEDKFSQWSELVLGNVFEQRTERAFGDEELLSISINGGIQKFDETVRKNNSSYDKSNYLRVYCGDIAYNSMRMWQGASGVSSFDGIVSPAYTVLKGNSKHSSIFFSYMFKTDKMIFEFQKHSQGLTSDTWNLKYAQLKTIKVKVPCLQEQLKISHFLSSIDHKLTLKKEELDKLKIWKQGLLQQMFV